MSPTLVVSSPCVSFFTAKVEEMKPKNPVLMRQATHDDVLRLVAMNHAAYPDLVEENVVWNEEQLRTHLAVFPSGQLVAERDGVIVGALSTFIVPASTDALAQHTWYEITDNGTFKSHDDRGEPLYLADVYVDPSAWGSGVGAALYTALRDMCRTLGRKRIVAGGRLWAYFEFAQRLRPEEYVAQVIAGQIPDRVLTSQLRAGFAVRGILKNYLQDGRSRSFATLLEWKNPDVSV